MTLLDSNPTSFTPLTPSNHQTMSTEHPMDVISQDILTSNMHLGVPDLPRKRCASDIDDERTVKALKREPADDAPLATFALQDPFNSPPIIPTFTSVQPFVQMVPSNALPPSRPSSRPPTPSTAFSLSTAFNPIQPQVQSSPECANFVPAGPHPVVGHTSASVPIMSDVPHPSLARAPWSDPQVPTISTTMASPTRHQYSLSVGSNPAVPVHPAPNAPVAFPSMPQATMAPPSAAHAEVVPAPVGPPAGEVTRTASFNSIVPKTMYAMSPYGVPYADSSAAASLYQSHNRAAPVTRPRQQSWHSGNNSSNKIFTLTKDSGQLASDDEDADYDSDSEESTSGKAVIQHVRFYLPLLSVFSQLFVQPTGQAASMVTDLSPECIQDLDRIFETFLNDLCSNRKFQFYVGIGVSENVVDFVSGRY